MSDGFFAELLRQKQLRDQQPSQTVEGIQAAMQGIMQGIQLFDLVKGLGTKYGRTITEQVPGTGAPAVPGTPPQISEVQPSVGRQMRQPLGVGGITPEQQLFQSLGGGAFQPSQTDQFGSIRGMSGITPEEAARGGIISRSPVGFPPTGIEPALQISSAIGGTPAIPPETRQIVIPGTAKTGQAIELLKAKELGLGGPGVEEALRALIPGTTVGPSVKAQQFSQSQAFNQQRMDVLNQRLSLLQESAKSAKTADQKRTLAAEYNAVANSFDDIFRANVMAGGTTEQLQANMNDALSKLRAIGDKISPTERKTEQQVLSKLIKDNPDATEQQIMALLQAAKRRGEF